jgi:hypothetical protein
MQFVDRFLGSDLHHEVDPPQTLEAAAHRPDQLSADVAAAGWSCRFYSRLSLLDRTYLETALDVRLATDDDDVLLAVCIDFHPRITLFLFATEVDGLYEFILMPWEGSGISVAEITAAAQDVIDDVVKVIGCEPFDRESF